MFKRIGIQLKKEEIIKRIKEIHKDEYDLSSLEYKNAETPIVLKCKKHGKFEIMPCVFLKTSKSINKCKICYIEEKRNFLLNESKNKFIDKYEYLDSEFLNTQKNCLSTSLLRLKCKIHDHEFNINYKNHMSSEYGGCRYCKLNKKLENNLISHLDKNKFKKDNYEYIFNNKTTPSNEIEIKCKIHNIVFKQFFSYHITKYGVCPECANYIKGEELKKEAIKKFGEEFDYSKVHYKGCKVPVTIICKKHGEFEQTFLNHIYSKTPCPKCGERIESTEDFIKIAKTIHHDAYDYSKVDYKNLKIPISIICPYHGEFRQIPSNHLYNKNGCPKCSQTSNTSTDEIKWLNTHRVPIRQERVEGYLVDGFDGDKHVFEYLGDFWHGNPRRFPSSSINKVNKKTFGELYEFTIKKFKYLKERGYKITYIWETDYLNNKPSCEFIDSI